MTSPLTHWQHLADDVEAAIEHHRRRGKGGQQVGIGPALARCPLSALLELQRRCRWAIESAGEEAEKP